jgi:hypothetical protein
VTRSAAGDLEWSPVAVEQWAERTVASDRHEADQLPVLHLEGRAMESAFEVAPGKTWKRRKACHVETSYCHLAGNQPRPVTAGHWPEASLASGPTHGHRGRPARRSVDSECVGRVMEPRNVVIAGAGGVFKSDGNTDATYWQDAEVPPGSESRAHAQQGGPGTWESLSSP